MNLLAVMILWIGSSIPFVLAIYKSFVKFCFCFFEYGWLEVYSMLVFAEQLETVIVDWNGNAYLIVDTESDSRSSLSL